MTDLDRYLEFLKSVGFNQVGSKLDGRYTLDSKQFMVTDRTYAAEDGIKSAIEFPEEPIKAVTLGSGKGYGGFYIEFVFDTNGSFLYHACWE